MAEEVTTSIQLALSEQACHAFFINNPITLIVACMAISYFQIPMERVVVFPIRNMDCSPLSGVQIVNPEQLEKRRLDRVTRAMGRDPVGIKIRRILESEFGAFLTYTFWASSAMREILGSRQCLGHIYLEEGDMAHRDTAIRPLALRKGRFWDTARRRRETMHYLPGASGYLSFSKDAFPFVPQSKKLHLGNLHDIFIYYRPKLLGIGTIVLAPYRPAGTVRWSSYWDQIWPRVVGPVCVKPHPRFDHDQAARSYLEKSFLEGLYEDTFILAPTGTIIEAEMIAEKKEIIGTASSLFRYAEQLGSTVIVLDKENV